MSKYNHYGKRCSNCGKVVEKLELSTRVYTCDCGNKMNRDVNAAINIAIEGFRLIATKDIEQTI